MEFEYNEEEKNENLITYNEFLERISSRFKEKVNNELELIPTDLNFAKFLKGKNIENHMDMLFDCKEQMDNFNDFRIKIHTKMCNKYDNDAKYLPFKINPIIKHNNYKKDVVVKNKIKLKKDDNINNILTNNITESVKVLYQNFNQKKAEMKGLNIKHIKPAWLPRNNVISTQIYNE